MLTAFVGAAIVAFVLFTLELLTVLRVGPWVVRHRWFMPPWSSRFTAITLHPFVILKSGWSSRTLRHELVHVHQVRRDGWCRFYGRYVWLWITGTAYRDMPAEVEARMYERSWAYLPLDLEDRVRADPRGEA